MKLNRKMIIMTSAIVILLSSFVMLDFKLVSASSRGSVPGGSGSFEGTLSDVFCVVVPTLPDNINQNQEYKSPYDFIMDPKGLAQNGSLLGKNLEPGASIYFENTETDSNYDWSSTSDALTIINKSTMNVDVKLTAELTGMDGIKLAGDKSFPYDTSASVYLALTDGQGKTSAIDKYGAAIKTTLEGKKDAYKVIWDDVAKKYRYDLRDDLEENNIKFDNYTFRLTGACNSSNSWSKVSGEIKPTVTVTWVVAPRSKNIAPSIEKKFYAMNKGCAITMCIDLGAGNLAATDIEKITYNNSSGVATDLPITNYTFANGELRLRASYISRLIDGEIGSRIFTVYFNDSARTKVAITLATDDMKPSIEQTSYNMVNGQPILVNVDLGAGTLGATGIKSITYLNSSGVKTTLSTNYYTFEAGKLRFKASYISSLVTGGITERIYTIVFDDKTASSTVITLSVNGIAPSVKQTDYTMHKDTSVEVEIDLGTDGWKANGIEAITYKNSSGNTNILSLDNYEYVNGTLSIKASFINTLINGGISSRAYTIIFDNAMRTTETITLNAVDEAPSIDGNEFIMTKGQPIFVDVHLGSGGIGATGIKSITYINSSGATATLSTNYYTFTEGRVRFKASYIESLLNGGFVSRTFTITLNDKAETNKTIVFKANGTAPSITSGILYVMVKNQAILVTIDLGTDDLQATGIKYITYKNSSGVTTTLPTDKYTFDNGTLRLKVSFINSLLNGSFASREYTIVFDNPMNTQAKFTLKK